MSAICIGSRKAMMGIFKTPENEHLAPAPEILQNKMHEPSTDVALCWAKEKQRQIGKAAISSGKRNLKQLFLYLPRLLGLLSRNKK